MSDGALRGEHSSADQLAIDINRRQRDFVTDFLHRLADQVPHGDVCSMRGMRCGVDGIVYALHEIARLDGRRDNVRRAGDLLRYLESIREALPYPENNDWYAQMLSHSDAAYSLWQCVAGHRRERHGAAFIDLANHVQCEGSDFVVGTAGWLQGALTVEVCARNGGSEDLLRRAKSMTDRLRDRLRQELRGAGAARLDDSFAHGWPGVLYVLMSAAALRRAPLDGFETEIVASVADRSQDAGDGRRQLGGAEAAANWCAGSAGHIYFWVRAWQSIGDARYGSLAADAAKHCGSGVNSARSGLCCGLAGQAAALAHYAGATGDAGAWSRACTLGALAALRPTNVPTEYENSLMLGKAGVALAQVHILAGSAPPMPFLWAVPGGETKVTYPISTSVPEQP